jgi:hypothetical protein
MAALAVGLCAPSAFAITKHYELGAGSFVSGNTSDPGLTIDTAIDTGVSGRMFDLNDGQSITFSFFQIWATGGIVGGPAAMIGGFDDSNPISATLDFTDPSTGVTVKGLTFGGYSQTGQYGEVMWNDSVLVDIPGDRSFMITLNNAAFNSESFTAALFDVLPQEGAATINVTVTQVSSTVPDGASTAALLGLAFLGLGALRRKIGV